MPIEVNAQYEMKICDKRKKIEDGVTLGRGGADDAILEDPDDPRYTSVTSSTTSSTEGVETERNWAEVSPEQGA